MEWFSGRNPTPPRPGKALKGHLQRKGTWIKQKGQVEEK